MSLMNQKHFLYNSTSWIYKYEYGESPLPQPFDIFQEF